MPIQGLEMAFPDLDVDRGQELLLLGASGTGKTTLLHLIAGMRTPDCGEVELDGDPSAPCPRRTGTSPADHTWASSSRPPTSFEA